MNQKGKNAYWQRYKTFVKERTRSAELNELNSMDEWRNKLFTNFITYVLPSCFIALIPGVYMSVKSGFMMVAICDVMAVALIALGALNPYLNLNLKKGIVVLVLYFLSAILMVYLSLLGPGLVYLLTLSVVISLTCTSRWAYGTVALNLLICTACALVIHLKLLDVELVKDYSLAVWITVSSNLVFLSFLIVLLIRKAIQALENTISKEQLLKSELYQKTLDQSETNQLLRESEGHYKRLFNQNPSPMWILDNESFQFLQVNDAAIAHYGYSTEEFLSMNIKDVRVEKEEISIRYYLEETEKSGSPVKLFTKHKRKSGEHFYVAVIFNSITFRGRAAILAISNDISEQMKYLKSIQEQNEQLKEISWIQSHKVRAPLTSILGLIDLYKLGIPEVEINEIINGIFESAEKLDEAIKETVSKSIPLRVE